VHHDGGVTVSAPAHASNERIREAVKVKEKWILDHVERVRRQIGGIDELVKLPLADIPHRVVIDYDTSRRGRVHLDEATAAIRMRTPSKSRRIRVEAMVKFLKKHCAATIAEEVNALAKAHKITINNVFFRNQKTRWGSSSSRGNISFNFRIALVPPQIRRYLIIHEIVHQQYMNHSQEFWREVARICPDHKNCDRWLKDHAFYLGLFR
jgi:predicted metal-dependent hydrolase